MQPISRPPATAAMLSAHPLINVANVHSVLHYNNVNHCVLWLSVLTCSPSRPGPHCDLQQAWQWVGALPCQPHSYLSGKHL